MKARQTRTGAASAPMERTIPDLEELPKKRAELQELRLQQDKTQSRYATISEEFADLSASITDGELSLLRSGLPGVPERPEQPKVPEGQLGEDMRGKGDGRTGRESPHTRECRSANPTWKPPTSS